MASRADTLARLEKLRTMNFYDHQRYDVRDELVMIAGALNGAVEMSDREVQRLLGELVEAQAEIVLLRAMLAESLTNRARRELARPIGWVWDRLRPRSRSSRVIGAVYDWLRP